MSDQGATAGGGPAWSGAGLALGLLFGTVAHVRGTKPLHPQGAVLGGRLLRHGGARSGIAWVDTAGEDDVLVRLSRSVGLPSWSPDVQGLALRHHDADVLLSVTGSAPVLRHVLRPQRTAGHGAYTCLLPYRGPGGPVLIGAQVRPARTLPRAPAEVAEKLRDAPLRLRLVWARLAGPWRPFGWLEVGGLAQDALDVPVRFRPAQVPAGLDTYDWVRRVREPSYAAARRVPADRASAVPVKPSQPREHL